MRSGTTNNNPIHKVNCNTTIKCWRCNRESHTPDYCIFKLRECYSCHGKGHIRSTCQQVKKFKRNRKVNVVKCTQIDDASGCQYTSEGGKEDGEFKEADDQGILHVGCVNRISPPPIKGTGRSEEVEILRNITFSEKILIESCGI